MEKQSILFGRYGSCYTGAMQCIHAISHINGLFLCTAEDDH